MYSNQVEAKQHKGSDLFFIAYIIIVLEKYK